MMKQRILAAALFLLGLALPCRADGPLTGAVIVVDPGHGGQAYSKSYTGGTRGVNSQMTESELNLRVSKELVKWLEEQGATVYITREADHRLSFEGSTNWDELHARNDFFDHYNPHFFLSVHHNAGAANLSGHTALYKHNASDDKLYESLAAAVNDELAAAVLGPKRKTIKGNYHILRETEIPGTISEAGFVTNKAYDELSNQPDYPAKEATAIGKGAVKYWTEHKEELSKLRDKLSKERAAKPRDPNTYTANDINPAFQKKMRALLTKVAPEGKYEANKVPAYLKAFQKEVVTDAKEKFEVKADIAGDKIFLSGETSHRPYHNQLIDMLVAMKLYDITNNIQLPPVPKKDATPKKD
jgi:N-acetylmuramoyl-L-alanine amidase